MTARWITFLLMAAMGVAVQAQSQSQDRFALTTAQVALAVSASGVPTAAEHVSLLTRVVGTEPEPALDVLSVETLGKGPLAGHSDDRFRVKLACHVARECLPFYAIISSTPSTAGPANTLSTTGRAMWNERSEITMKAGTHATLMLDDQRSHIQVAVVSLENGIVGHRIHVASPDRKQTYVGEVVNARLLRGSF
jgi:hypothetical protein